MQHCKNKYQTATRRLIVEKNIHKPVGLGQRNSGIRIFFVLDNLSSNAVELYMLTSSLPISFS